MALTRRRFLAASSAACACAPAAGRAEEAEGSAPRAATETGAPPEVCTALPAEVVDSRMTAIEEWAGNSPAASDDSEAAALKGNRWNPARRSLNVDFLAEPAGIDRVIAAARLWEPHTGIAFRFGTGAPDILVDFRPGGGHSSQIGTDSLLPIKLGRASMNIDLSGWRVDVQQVALHEFGHALGLIHEHQHPDAPIPWNKPVVNAYYKARYGWEPSEVETFVFRKYDRTQVNRTVYDPTSIMQYAIPREHLTDPAFATGWSRSLSDADKALAAALFRAA